MSSLLIVGGGKMGGALLGGLLRSGWAGVADVTVVEPVAERRDELAAEYPGLRTVAAPEPGLLGDAGERIARRGPGGQARRGGGGVPRPRA